MAKDFYRDFLYTLAAGEIRWVAAYGSYLTILDNNTGNDIVVSIDGNAGQAIPAGISVELPADQNYAGFYIQNTSGGNITVRFAISSGKIVDARFKTSAVLNVNVASGTLAVTNADITSIKNNTRSLNGDTPTQINKDGNAAGVATTVIYTPSGALTGYITSSLLAGELSTADYGGSLFVTNAADVTQFNLSRIISLQASTAAFIPRTYPTPVKIPNGWKVKIQSTAAAQNLYGYVNGWEE